MNFGLWEIEQSSNSFSAACAALARAVADAAGMPHRSENDSCDVEDDRLSGRRRGTGVSVLDLGCGCGDQLLLWAREYNVSSISACTPERKQVVPAPLPAPKPAFLFVFASQSSALFSARRPCIACAMSPAVSASPAATRALCCNRCS
jgi:hypothetical protein